MENYHSRTAAITPPLQHQIPINGQGTKSSKPKHSVLHTDAAGEVTLVYTFSEEEYKKGIAAPNNRKDTSIDHVLVKQLNNLGPTFHNWLLDMLNKCFTENMVPLLWKQSMFNAILKPYKPISLLCHMYKINERLIHKQLKLLKDTSSRNRQVLSS